MTMTADVKGDAVSQAFFQAYKPFRNRLRSLGLEESLKVIWQYSAHISGELKLPPGFHGLERDGKPLDISQYIYPWDLALLAREILLNASHVGTASLLKYSVLNPIINDLHYLSSFSLQPADCPQLLLHLHRLAHQQFPVQRGVRLTDVMRYKLIFEHSAMADLFESGVGLSPRMFYLLGFSVVGAVMTKPNFVTSSDYQKLGISDAQRDKFFNLMVRPLSLLREEISENQRFGRSWAFTVNPLQRTPLVNLNPSFPNRTYCPVPYLVLRRITSSVYFDLIKKNGFDKAFGSAFEDYVGLVINKSRRSPAQWNIHKPRPYRMGKDTHHGTDWILTDGTANIFIECKIARIRAQAASAETYDDTEWTTQRLANMVVQNYANICEASSGATDWQYNDLPNFNVVVTLEDFFMVGKTIADPVREKVRTGLRAKKLCEQLIDKSPYSIVSAAEFEGICAVLNEHSAFDLFSKKNTGEHSQWLFDTFCTQPPYRNAWSKARQLHADDLTVFWHQLNKMSGGQFSVQQPGGPGNE